MNLVAIAKNYLSLSEEVKQLKKIRSDVVNRYGVIKAKPGTDARTLLAKYDRSITETESQITAVDEAILRCRPEVRDVLTKNLVQGQTLEYIAYNNYMGMTTVNRYKAIGLQKLAEESK